MEITNRFGTGELFTIDDIENKGFNIYCECTACMSVYSDFLSWASAYLNIFSMTAEVKNANVIIVLGCQVTDLAIYNDLITVEKLHKENPNAKIYIGGCLAQRFDIQLPEYANRLDVVRIEYHPISEVSQLMTVWSKPFWIKENIDSNNEFAKGNLFREMYPLKIGAGCHGKCAYCTIRDTRGKTYETDALLQVKEFLDNENIVLISDSPTAQQVKDWCFISKRYKKPISFRNVEPQIACACRKEITELSALGFLKIFHCPIQSPIAEILKTMNRNVAATTEYLIISQELRRNGTKVTTNIIIDYKTEDNKEDQKKIFEWMNENFDYWVWNPYFDGNFDFEKAKERFEKYIM